MGRQKRMSADGKEIVHNADLLKAQYLANNVRQQLFDRRSGSDKFFVHEGASVAGIGQRFAIHFAIDRQGQGVEPNERRRDHVFGQFVFQVRP